MSVDNSSRSMLARGLGVLRAFRSGEPELPLSEIARRADMPKATAHRIITELVKEGMLERGEKGLRLGMGLFMLGARVPRQLMLRDIAFPHAEQLHRLTHGSAFVFIADPTGADAALVDAVRRTHEPGRGLGMEETRASDRAATRVFRAFGAEDDAVAGRGARVREVEPARVRHQGFAVVRDVPGVVGVAAPVLTASGAAAGALAVAGPQAGFHVGLAAAHLKAACAAVSRALQRNPELLTAS
ncbi:helix-turn-helix domain-containing protein [Streptomyces sp. CB02400]|uniref:helix-turn-helix domain-containing protein n=1 Tax=unclassified Streptomyces TaxID=2593676 RepID=UPI000AC8CD8B|nr:helix-turn-helix domain-containing protein [Streptomyces sp. CB02400]